MTTRKHAYVRTEDETEQAAADGADAESPWMRCLRGSLGVGELQRWAEHGRAEASASPTAGRSMPKPKGLAAKYARFNLHAGASSVPGGLPAARERLRQDGSGPT